MASAVTSRRAISRSTRRLIASASTSTGEFERRRQGWQFGGQGERKVGAGQAEQAGERFVVVMGPQLCLRHARAHFCAEGGDLGLVELVAAAGFAYPGDQPCRRVGRGPRLFQEADLLARGDGPHVGAARVRRHCPSKGNELPVRRVYRAACGPTAPFMSDGPGGNHSGLPDAQ